MVPDELTGALGVGPYWHGVLPTPRFFRGQQMKDVASLFYGRECGLTNSRFQGLMYSY